MIVPSNDENNKDQDKKLFTIQYTKEELDKIQNDFLQQLSKYFDKVNRISRNEVEIVPPTAIIIEEEQQQKRV